MKDQVKPHSDLTQVSTSPEQTIESHKGRLQLHIHIPSTPTSDSQTDCLMKEPAGHQTLGLFSTAAQSLLI